MSNHTIMQPAGPSSTPRLSEADRRKVLTDWNQTAVRHYNDASVLTLFAEQVAQHPQNIALIDKTVTLTYRQLDQRANGLAYALRDKGVGPESVVALCLERSATSVVVSGILKAGAYMPLEPSYLC
ncbi:MAG: AMP-binding protein [Myxococcota bacterium]